MPRERKIWIGNPPTHKSFEPYVKAIGQAAIAWSGLHEVLRDIFWIMLGTDKPTSSAIWYSIRSDRSQRQMLKALAKSYRETGDLRKELADKIDALLKECDAVALTRDDVVHAPILSSLTGVVPNAYSGSPMASRLLNKVLLDEYRWCRDACLVISDYAHRISINMMTENDPEYPLPGTLKLPNRGQKKSRPSRPRQPPAKQRAPRRRA